MKARFAIAFVGSLAALGFRPGGTLWESQDSAPAKAQATGKPICYYFINNAAEKNGST
jgi:hypothetical protein